MSPAQGTLTALAVAIVVIIAFVLGIFVGQFSPASATEPQLPSTLCRAAFEEEKIRIATTFKIPPPMFAYRPGIVHRQGFGAGKRGRVYIAELHFLDGSILLYRLGCIHNTPGGFVGQHNWIGGPKS